MIFDARVLRRQPFAREREGFVRIAIKIVGGIPSGGKAGRMPTSNPLHEPAAWRRTSSWPRRAPPNGPSGTERSAVWRTARKSGCLCALQRSVRARHGDPMGTAALADPLLHQAQDVIDINDVDGAPKPRWQGGSPTARSTVALPYSD